MTLQRFVLLLVAGPGLLAAQRFEVAFLGGTSRPAGSVQQESGDVCDEPCPIAYRPISTRRYAYEQSTLQNANVLGLSAAARVGITVGRVLRLELGVTDHAYKLDFGDGGAPTDPRSVMRSGLQHDLVTSVGVAWAPRG